MCSGRTSYNMHQSIFAVTIPTQQPDLKKMEDNALWYSMSERRWL